MPKLNFPLTIDVPPERFLDTCSDVELKELYLLLSIPKYQLRLADPVSDPEEDKRQMVMPFWDETKV